MVPRQSYIQRNSNCLGGYLSIFSVASKYRGREAVVQKIAAPAKIYFRLRHKNTGLYTRLEGARQTKIYDKQPMYCNAEPG